MIDKPLITDGIALIRGMLTTIDLDDQSLLTANEIDNVGPDGFLTHKLEAREPT
jgi:hypothetical protein